MIRYLFELAWTWDGKVILGVGAFLAGVGSALSGIAAYKAAQKRKNGNGNGQEKGR